MLSGLARTRHARIRCTGRRGAEEPLFCFDLWVDQRELSACAPTARQGSLNDKTWRLKTKICRTEETLACFEKDDALAKVNPFRVFMSHVSFFWCMLWWPTATSSMQCRCWTWQRLCLFPGMLLIASLWTSPFAGKRCWKFFFVRGPAVSKITLPFRSSNYEDDEEHWRSCSDRSSCDRCFYESGFRGALRRGGRDGEADEAKAWGKRFTFSHSELGEKTWLVTTPYSYGRWGVGCWVCHQFPPDKYVSSFSRLEVSEKCFQVSSFQKHEKSPAHKAAIAKMKEHFGGEKPEDHGVLSGLQDVPRLEKFHLAGTVVARHDSYQDFASYASSLALTSGLPQRGTDLSSDVCQRMILALAQPLYEQDLAVMQKAFFLATEGNIINHYMKRVCQRTDRYLW